MDQPEQKNIIDPLNLFNIILAVMVFAIIVFSAQIQSKKVDQSFRAEKEKEESYFNNYLEKYTGPVQFIDLNWNYIDFTKSDGTILTVKPIVSTEYGVEYPSKLSERKGLPQFLTNKRIEIKPVDKAYFNRNFDYEAYVYVEGELLDVSDFEYIQCLNCIKVNHQ